MECSKCGTVIKDAKEPCPKCGHRVTEQEGMNSIIKHIFEEDAYTPKFETEKKGEAQGSKKLVRTPSTKKIDKKKDILPKKTNGKSTSQGDARSKKAVTKQVKGQEPSPKEHHLGDMIVQGLRYTLVGVILLFTLSLFFNWISLSGNAVNQGMIRTEAIKPFIEEAIRDHSIESLESYQGSIVKFSAMDLNNFGKVIDQGYLTVMGPADETVRSLVATMQQYYMKAILLILLVNLFSVIVIVVFKSLKAISIVRNLSVLNFAIIGLNYLALKVPYFSMIAVEAKDALSQTMDHPQIAMTHNGITLNQAFYPYVASEEKGFIFAIIMLTLWLLIGIILSEVRHRREEIAIEKGDIV